MQRAMISIGDLQTSGDRSFADPTKFVGGRVGPDKPKPPLFDTAEAKQPAAARDFPRRKHIMERKATKRENE